MLKDADIWSQVVTFPSVHYLVELENLKQCPWFCMGEGVKYIC